MFDAVLQIPVIGMGVEAFLLLLIAALAGGVAATAYAGKKYPEMEPDGWDYHFGKDIPYAFGTKPDTLAVGAASGLAGELIQRVLYSHSGTHVDPPAMAITVVMPAVGLLRPGPSPTRGISGSDRRPRSPPRC